MGASLNEQIVMTEELARIGAPYLPTQGLNNIGPILIEFGTDAQRARHLPPILAGKRDLGTRLFRAGAPDRNLASLSTGATLEGDHFVVRGQKVWQTWGAPRGLDVHARAHRSEGATAAGRHQLPAHRPAQPGREGTADPPPLSADDDFSEVFLDDVRVPGRGTWSGR